MDRCVHLFLSFSTYNKLATLSLSLSRSLFKQTQFYLSKSLSVDGLTVGFGCGRAVVGQRLLKVSSGLVVEGKRWLIGGWKQMYKV
ncbi:hypothetical protein Hanom_Chr14g01290601 [Helianthus anomalus]